jgi:hypothetical protein
MNRQELYQWFKQNPLIAKEVYNEVGEPYQNCPTALLAYYYEIDNLCKKEPKITIWQKIKNIFA